MSAAVGDGRIDEKWAAMMHAAIAGDEAAYRRLLEEIGRSVRVMARGAFARARVGDADIEDVVQETLLAIHLKRDTWDGGLRLSPWVAAIARHKIVDAMRRGSAISCARSRSTDSRLRRPRPGCR
jgi:RNA polymerase sigma-70 factor (ECF subfamily)